jgi:hypothetical protein
MEMNGVQKNVGGNERREKSFFVVLFDFEDEEIKCN